VLKMMKNIIIIFLCIGLLGCYTDRSSVPDKSTESTSVPITIHFESAHKGQDGSYFFGLEFNNDQKVYFRRVNEEIKGFKLVAHQEIVDESSAGKRPPSHKLSIQRGDKTFTIMNGSSYVFAETK